MSEEISESPTHEIVRDCLKQYGSYVLSDRAIPDVRDGLKPVQRRILWVLWKLGAMAKKVPIKSARVVGEIIGRYHPHGDAACYDTLVRLDSVHYQLVDGQGNFGNPKALVEDAAAAYRYTECRMSGFAERCFDDIHVVKMLDNYDSTDTEPEVLPARVPLVLLNGVEGIAVGLATAIPPHNLKEIVDATLHLIEHPDAAVQDLLQFVRGPDYGVGVLLSKKSDLLDMYTTGEGRLRFRCDYHVEDTQREGIKKLVITGLVPGIKKTKFLDTCKELYQKKLIESPVNNESTLKQGYRDTIEYRDAAIIQDRILPLLETSVQYRWYCKDTDERPHRYDLVSLLQEFIVFRQQIEEAVLLAEQKKLRRHLGTIVAKVRASQQIDFVVHVMKSAESDAAAIEQLCSKLDIKPWQAQVILDTTVKSLMRVAIGKMTESAKEIKLKLLDVQKDLNDVNSVVSRRLKEMLQYGGPRGTKLRTTERDIGTAQDYWAGVTAQGKIDVSLDLPAKSKATWPYCGFGKVQGDFLVVHQHGQVIKVHPSYLDRYEAPGVAIGLVADPYCIVVTRDRYVAFPTDQRRSNFPAMRDLGDVVGVVGFGPDDTVVVMTGQQLHKMEMQDIKVTRPNVKPHKLHFDEPVTGVTRVRSGERLVTQDGEEIGSAEFVDKELFCVGEQNLIQYQDGRRAVKTLDETLVELTKGLVKVVVSLT